MSDEIDVQERPFLAVLISVTVLICVLVLETYFASGVVEALRTVTSLVMPLSLIWLLILGTSIWWLYQRRFLLGTAYLMIWVATSAAFNDRLSAVAIGALEHDAAMSVENADGLADATPFRSVVILGGSVYVNPNGIAEINRDGQRVISAAKLWRAGDARTIICTGERAGVGDHQSKIAREILLSLGVPEEVIFEIGGENTTQEMQHLKRFLDSPPDGLADTGGIGLITSAFHMPRALRLAGENGLELVPLPCSFRSDVPTDFRFRELVPSLEAGIKMRMAIKERLAAVVGR